MPRPARGFSSSGNLDIVGADINLVDEPGGTACIDGALDPASSADSPKVLARHAFRAAAGGNDHSNSRIHVAWILSMVPQPATAGRP
jgi:hypothetical protein